jgi:hypothetical protein
VQILARPSVCGGLLAQKDRVLEHHNSEKEHRISTHKLRGGSRC